jgi:hypothetical protein
MGVTPEMIADKRDVFARNLTRAPLEVWPAAADRAGYVDLWVADAGSTERPAPEYPLLHEGAADVFEGIPFGVSQRGDVIAPALPGANLVFGGLMGQGKTNASRVTMAGAALDPIAELWVFVFAGNGAYDAYAPRLARYAKGVGVEVVLAAVDALRAAPSWSTCCRAGGGRGAGAGATSAATGTETSGGRGRAGCAAARTSSDSAPGSSAGSDPGSRRDLVMTP